MVLPILPLLTICKVIYLQQPWSQIYVQLQPDKTQTKITVSRGMHKTQLHLSPMHF